MKKSLILLSLLLAVGCSKKTEPQKPAKVDEVKKEVVKTTTNKDGVKWYPTLEEALEVAKGTDKKIVINFTGSDWCNWCIKLDEEVFSQPEFIEYAKEKLVMVKLDYPQNTPQDENQKKYNQQMLKIFQVQGFPTILVADANFQPIAKTGYVAGGAENYIKHLEEMKAPEKK